VESPYTGERRILLRRLAEALPRYGLVSRMVGEEEPLLWVWHPQTGGQTLVFATPARDGWLFLWGQGGRGDAENLDHTARALRDTLASA